MGNEIQSKSVYGVDNPPTLKALKQKSQQGFNSYDALEPEEETTFRQIVTDTLQGYKSNEVSGIIGNVMDEVDEQYNTGSDTLSISSNESKQSEKQPLTPECLVSPQNMVPNIETVFRYIRQLGSGASCRVLKARHLKNNKIYAVKELTKKHAINKELFCREVELLKKLCHPNILRYFDCYQDDNCYYIATEYCSGGTMLDRIVRMQSFSEQKASKYIKTILSAVKYMHSLNIVHRDLKAQNMVFDKAENDGVLQIIDFGDSKLVKDTEIYKEFVGTIHYVPPEIVSPRTGRVLKKSDMWSIGVITYLLVCGRPPFRGKSQKEILRNIIAKPKKIEYPKGCKLTDSCIDFIEKLLTDDPEKRLCAAYALKHPWIAGEVASSVNLCSDVLHSLKQYTYNNKLQDILVNAILLEMEAEEQQILSKGLIVMNRQNSHVDATSLVDYLLLHSSIPELPRHQNKEWQRQRMNEVQMYHSSSGQELDFDHGAIDSIKRTHELFDSMDWDELGGIDVDYVLDAVEKKERELELSVTEEKFNENRLITLMDDDEDDADDDYDTEEEEEEDFKDEESGQREARMRARTQSSVDPIGRRISVSRFRAIMDKSDKNYNVENIVDDLDDGTGHIKLLDIASYKKRVDTLKDVFQGQTMSVSSASSPKLKGGGN